MDGIVQIALTSAPPEHVAGDHDIRDLLIEIPDYRDAPDIDLQNVLQNTSGGGGQSPFDGDTPTTTTKKPRSTGSIRSSTSSRATSTSRAGRTTAATRASSRARFADHPQHTEEPPRDHGAAQPDPFSVRCRSTSRPGSCFEP